MQQNTTDLIAKTAWDATKTYWKEFMLLPFSFGILVGLIELLIINQISMGIGGFLLVILLWIATLVFGLTFSTAILKWCNEIFSGKKSLDVKGGLQYGLSRFWGVLGTLLITGLKIFLWSLLLILPGLYKAVMYSQSIKISQLEQKSGSKANRMSTALIKEAGFLRTIGNLAAIKTVTLIIMYLLMLAIMGLIFLFATVLQFPYMLVTVTGSVVLGAIMLFAITFMFVFSNFQYLYYRDETKPMLTKMAKTL